MTKPCSQQYNIVFEIFLSYACVFSVNYMTRILDKCVYFEYLWSISWDRDLFSSHYAEFRTDYPLGSVRMLVHVVTNCSLVNQPLCILRVFIFRRHRYAIR